MEHAQHSAPRGQNTASGRKAEFFDLFDEELGGGRPPPLLEVAAPQAWVRRAVEKTEDFVPLVQILDAPLSQTVDDVLGFFRLMDLPVAEQAVKVPLISSSSCPSRVVPLVPQMVEQLVEVPTPFCPDLEVCTV